MAVLRLFAAARDAAGTGRVEMSGLTVSDVLAEARARFGDDFAQVLAGSRVWVNGEPVEDDRTLSTTDEVAVLPPVSGGAG
jgi:MoaD family protein